MAGPIPSGETLPDLVLVPPGTIAGRVTTATGGVPRRFTVQPRIQDGRVWKEKNFMGTREFNQPERWFSIEDLLPGSYLVVIRCNELGSFLKEVRVKPGGEAFLEAVLEEGWSVEGTVLSADDDKPVAGVTVYVEPELDDRSSYREARSDATGIFTLQGLPDGQFCLATYHPEYVSAGAR